MAGRKTIFVPGSSGLIGSEVCLFNSCSILEAFELTIGYSREEQKYAYAEGNRSGDPVCYYSDLRKMRAHYPNWDKTTALENSVASWRERPS